MKNKKIIIAAAAILIVISGVIYYVYDGLTGNHVEIESVIAQSPADDSSTEVSGSAGEGTATEAATGAGNKSSGAGAGEAAGVDGTWTINSADPAQTKAEGTVDVTSMDSRNSQRDQHISEAEYLDTAQFPNATFNVTSFEGLPAEWKSGEAYEVSITGDLTVKGITNDMRNACRTRCEK